MINTNFVNNEGWSISSALILHEAKLIGYEYKIISVENNLFVLSGNNQQYLFKNIDCGLNSYLSGKITKNKELTYIILGNNGYNIPNSIYISKKDYNETYLNNINLNYPLVVKPIDTGQGNGVTVNINNIESLKSAVEYAFEFADRVIIQNFVYGDDYRLVVVGNKFIAASKRLPPFVVGDGKSTIKELIDLENKNPFRGDKDHDKPLSKIIIDKPLIAFLNGSGYSVETVLENGNQVFLRKNANLSTGGIAIDVTDEIHYTIKNMAINIANQLGLLVCGIDILSTNISLDVNQSNSVIIEVNSTPGLRMHHFPYEGKERNVAKEILNLRFGG